MRRSEREIHVLLRSAGRRTMRSGPILFISNQKMNSNSVLAAVKATGHRVLSTSSTQAPALLFIMHCVAVVVLHDCGSEKTSVDVAQHLRAICPDVPIILLSAIPTSPLPSHVDACINPALPPTNLTCALLRVLTAARERHWRDSLGQGP